MKTARILWAVVIVAIGLGATAPAATFVWDGGGTDSNLSTPADWNPDGAPPNDGTADLQFGSVRTSPIPDANWSVNSITFTSGAPAFTIGSASPNANIVSVGAGGITNNSANTQTINSALRLLADQTWNMGTKNLTIGTVSTTKQLDLNGHALTIVNASNPQINIYEPIISGSGAGSIVLTAGYNHLRSNNSSTGGIVFSGGQLWLDNVNGIGGGGANLTWQGGTIMFSSSASLTNNVVVQVAASTTYTLSIYTIEAAFAGNISGAVPANGVLKISRTVSPTVDTTAGRVHFSGNNSGWTWPVYNWGTTAPLYIDRDNVYLDSVNAMGVSNNVYIGIGNSTFGGSGLCSLFASNGVPVTGNINVNHAGTTSNYGGDGDVILGQYGGGLSTFSGQIMLNGVNNSSGYTAVRSVVLSAGSNGVATFSNVIQDGGTNSGIFYPIVVRGAGTVRLAANNTYRGATTIRAGTLLLGTNAPSGAPGALGTNATSVVKLGDTTTTLVDVRVATPPNPAANSWQQYVGSGWTLTSSNIVWNTGTGPTAIDGVTLNNGDRILYMNDASWIGGIYVRTSQDQWDRATDFDEVKAGEIGYGASVYVQHGTQEGGHRFYLGNQDTPFVLGTTPFVWSMEEYNPNVALLTDGPFTVGRAINVVSNNSTGTSTLGGNTGTTSTFSGTITFNRDVVLSAASNGWVNFNGVITGACGVAVSGGGVVSLNASNKFTGPITINAGSTLAVGTNVTTYTTANSVTNLGTLLVAVNTAGNSDRLAVSGDLVLGVASSLSVANTNALNYTKTYTIATYTGNRVGTFASVVPREWRALYDDANKQVRLYRMPHGMMLEIQ